MRSQSGKLAKRPHLRPFRVDEMLARSCNPSISIQGPAESVPWLRLFLLEPRSLRPAWGRAWEARSLRGR